MNSDEIKQKPVKLRNKEHEAINERNENSIRNKKKIREEEGNVSPNVEKKSANGSDPRNSNPPNPPWD